MSSFKIPVIPKTENKCIRLPVSMIEQIEKELVGRNASFTGFVTEAIRYALENLEEQRTPSERHPENVPKFKA